MIVRWLLMLAALAAALPAMAAEAPILIAHRGASGERPEHTLAAYALAIEQGADFIEPDLVLTKDGVLIARHENEIGDTTNVSSRPEFALRRTTKTIDGEAVTGWFTEDFTLAEVRTLRARERIPALRPANAAFDGQFAIPTFDEILALVAETKRKTGRSIGIYPETKHPSYFAGIGLPHEAPLLAALAGAGYTKASDPVFIQSFEVGNLQRLSRKTKLRLIQLVAASEGPWDRREAGLSYSAMIRPKALAKMARNYAYGIGAEKSLVIARDAAGNLGAPTGLIADAHKAGLKVHVWTMRAENYFLPTALKSGTDPHAKGDLAAEVRAFVAAGVDGLFSDNVKEARMAIGQ